MPRLMKLLVNCAVCGSSFHPHTKPKNAPPSRYCSYACNRADWGRTKKDPQARFWAKVDKSGDGGCWNWTRSVSKSGYGAFGVTPKDIRYAHRYAWETLVGPIPDGLCLLHSCDNPRCVNPAHLRVGNRTENSQDRTERGRVPKGEFAGQAKITEAVAKAIKDDPRPQAEIAKEAGVTQGHVSRIKSGQVWGHLS